MSTNKLAIQMVREYLKKDMLVSTKDFLLTLLEALQEPTVEQKEVIKFEDKYVIISCDASIKENPGGPASVGVVIQVPGKDNLQFAKGTPATTNNQAEYDAIYTGLVTLINLNNNPGCPIVIRSDSQLAIRQLNMESECHDKKLERKRNLIRELASQLPVPVVFEWRPRNSTTELQLANHLAQDLLGVPRH